MNLYSLEEVKQSVSCEDFLIRKGYTVSNHRCAAAWRGGNGLNVSLEGPTFYDHKEKFGGSVIDLCNCLEKGANVKASGLDISKCLSIIGDLFGLTPKLATKRREYDYRTSPHYIRDVNDGYSEKTKYVYTDESGNPRHMVIRMEHPAKPKDFIQCTPWSGSLSGVETVLYNLPQVIASQCVIVVEGEKDADTLNALGFVATTCNNGSDHWRDSYTETLRGKNVIVCRDNDQAGLDHAHLVLRSLANAAANLRLVCPSSLPKGDVTDWLEKEGGTKEKFTELVKNSPNITPEEAMWSDEKLELYQAKQANETSFANYRMDTVRVRRGKDAGKEQEVEVPLTIREMLKETRVRFLRFPRRIGESTLFDHNRDTGKIELITGSAALIAWIGERSNKRVMWKNGTGFVTKEEFYEAEKRTAKQYEKISEVPNWPTRTDVYYTYRDALKPTPGHAAFNRFMAFFNPADAASAVLMRAMVASMMYYKYGVQRPCWIVDSPGGQAAGKTTFVEIICHLYKTNPIKTSAQELTRDAKELNKRIVSVTGRNSMMLLVDNVKGTFENVYFADLVTCFSISGKAPYGLGEESRPNDLTYVMTSNSANIGSDIASRSFIFYIAPPPKRTKAWKGEVMAFIDKHRFEILGDIVDILEHTNTPNDFMARTRVPEFEADVLYKMAGSQEVFDATIESVMASRTEANVDEENAVLVVEAIKEIVRDAMKCNESHTKPDDFVCFLRSNLINKKIGKSLGLDTQDVRNMVNTNKIACIRKGVRRYPDCSRSPYRASGVLFVGEDVNLSPYVGNVRVHILGLNQSENIIEVTQSIGGIEDIPLTNELRAEARAKELAAANAGAIDVESAYVGGAAAAQAPAPRLEYDADADTPFDQTI